MKKSQANDNAQSAHQQSAQVQLSFFYNDFKLKEHRTNPVLHKSGDKVITKDETFQKAARLCVMYEVVGVGGSRSGSRSGSGSRSKHDWETIEQEAVKEFSSLVCTGDKSFVLKIQGGGVSVMKEDSVQFCLHYAAEEVGITLICEDVGSAYHQTEVS
jgi:hypothetical protein